MRAGMRLRHRWDYRSSATTASSATRCAARRTRTSATVCASRSARPVRRSTCAVMAPRTTRRAAPRRSIAAPARRTPRPRRLRAAERSRTPASRQMQRTWTAAICCSDAASQCQDSGACCPDAQNCLGDTDGNKANDTCCNGGQVISSSTGQCCTPTCPDPSTVACGTMGQLRLQALPRYVQCGLAVRGQRRRLPLPERGL